MESHCCMIMQDSIVSRTAIQKLNMLLYEILSHAPYSPDLSPTDYHFFKHLNRFLVQKQFKYKETIKIVFQEFFQSKNLDFYKTGLNMLVERVNIGRNILYLMASIFINKYTYKKTKSFKRLNPVISFATT